MAGPYTSVRILSNDLLGIRLSATRNSLWAVEDTPANYAYMALNDAVAQYPVPVKCTFWSAMFHTSGTFAGIPPAAQTVLSVRDYSTNAPIRHYRIYTTPNTTLLSVPDYTGHAVVTYKGFISWFPRDTTLYTDDMTMHRITTVPIYTWSGSPAVLANPSDKHIPSFPTAGYLEITVPGEAGYEVTGYEMNAVYHSSGYARVVFTTGARQVVGAMPYNTGWTTETVNWAEKAVLSYALVGVQQYVRPIVLAAEAAMYQYWMADRAAYDKFTAIASSQYLLAKDMLQLINTYEARAMLTYRNIRADPLDSPANTSRLRDRLPK